MRFLKTIVTSALLGVALLTVGCVGALQGGVLNIGDKPAQSSYASGVTVTTPTGAGVPNLSVTVRTDGDQSFACDTDFVNHAVCRTQLTGGAYATISGTGFVSQTVRFVIGAQVTAALVPVLTIQPAASRDIEIALPWTFEGRHCQTEQFGDLPMFDPFYISLNAADRKHWRDCHKRDGDRTIMVGFYAEYGEAGQPFGSGQLVPPTDLTSRWVDYRAIVKETRSDCDGGLCLQTILYMSGDNGLEYMEWAAPQAIQALRPQPDDLIDLADGQEFFLCFDSCVPGYQPPSRVNDGLLFMRAHLTPREIISIELAAGYASWCGGASAMVTLSQPAECGREDYESAAGQQLDKIYLEYPLWSTVNDQYWQTHARLLGPAYRRAPTQPADDDPGAPYPADSGRFYLGAGTPRGSFVVGCMEATQYGDVRNWYTRQDDDDAKAYRVAQGCLVVN